MNSVRSTASALARRPLLAAPSGASAAGALTVAVVNNPDSAMERQADCCLVAATGAEAVAGSTRMAAGTAQKIILNSLSTLVMSQLGYLHDNLMICMRAHYMLRP